MKAFETLTVNDTAKALSPGIYGANIVGGRPLEIANKATILVEGASMRYRVDGSDPTTTIGLLANNGDVITLLGRNEIKLFRAIRTTGTDAIISCDYSHTKEI